MDIEIKDKRLRNYINKVYRNHGITQKKVCDTVRVSENWTLLEYEELLTFTPFRNPDIKIFKNKESNDYLAVLFMPGEDYYTIYWRSKSYLNVKQVLNTLLIVHRIESIFSLRDEAYFLCWECGTKSHFLDIAADSLKEKWSKYENFCCCD
ncbi:hypothetical protein [Evansella halocellulosilytica]|uniref:hypothetical protein n=1 Tax=Evansella halocellulosilytica TaxID=2011013 RepID=UPI000BB96244|nr:hypothetical protein [Evansella halocellulosilytica]